MSSEKVQENVDGFQDYLRELRAGDLKDRIELHAHILQKAYDTKPDAIYSADILLIVRNWLMNEIGRHE